MNLDTKQNPCLQSNNNYATLDGKTDRELFLGLRQGLLMIIAAEEKAYHERRAAFYLQLAAWERFLGVERTQKR